MAFNKRREYLFVYSVKDANPNGDPLNANHPRYDEEAGQVLVSDVRIKRTIRDQWVRNGLDVFIDGEPKTAQTRIKELEKKLEISEGNGKEICGSCIDTRLFGVTYPVQDNSFSWIGPVQFKWGRSLHQVKPEFIQGTAAFARKDDSDQRSFRNEYLVPFAIIGGYAIANQNASRVTGATEEDLAALKSALWDGTINLITRSKVGHVPLMLLEIVYREGFQGAIGSLDQKVCLKKPDGGILNKDEERSIRKVQDIQMDISSLNKKMAAFKSQIASIGLRRDPDLSIIGLDDLKFEVGDLLIEE